MNIALKSTKYMSQTHRYTHIHTCTHTEYAESV